ncbi:hypothetical protein M513_07930 [Trichuris suis]|uniref:Uncharacterized protein n=1 Tax=Trichuris suis TaxID=68888 RepID=A0A085M1S0_9BILA|nr:hypothetical protein M513_07930 [Trichuris suis]
MDDAKRAVSTWCNTQPPGFYKERLRRSMKSKTTSTGLPGVEIVQEQLMSCGSSRCLHYDVDRDI